jgi:hypothetical protein
MTTTDYDALLVKAVLILDGTSGTTRMRLNSDSGTNYNWQMHRSSGTSISSSSSTGDREFWGRSGDANSNIYESMFFIVTNLASYKKAITGECGAKHLKCSISGDWNETSNTISAITVARSAGNFSAGSTLTVWGLKNA